MPSPRRDFLPRGQGIVTRRPLILQLEHLADPGAREYGEFQHLKTGEQFYDFHEIMREIEDETQVTRWVLSRDIARRLRGGAHGVGATCDRCLAAPPQRHIAKVKKMVDAAPIHLRIASPKVPNLTLIDMPGEAREPSVYAGRCDGHGPIACCPRGPAGLTKIKAHNQRPKLQLGEHRKAAKTARGGGAMVPYRCSALPEERRMQTEQHAWP